MARLDRSGRLEFKATFSSGFWLVPNQSLSGLIEHCPVLSNGSQPGLIQIFWNCTYQVHTHTNFIHFGYVLCTTNVVPGTYHAIVWYVPRQTWYISVCKEIKLKHTGIYQYVSNKANCQMCIMFRIEQRTSCIPSCWLYHYAATEWILWWHGND